MVDTVFVDLKFGKKTTDKYTFNNHNTVFVDMLYLSHIRHGKKTIDKYRVVNFSTVIVYMVYFSYIKHSKKTVVNYNAVFVNTLYLLDIKHKKGPALSLTCCF
jgi:hypothetical protein